MPTIQIVDLLVQGNAGQVGHLLRENVVTIIEHSGHQNPDRIAMVTSYIKQIAMSAEKTANSLAPNRQEGSRITRVTTDEFSFYPEDAPFTIEEYKELIKNTTDIANAMPRDTEMVLATFPVVWPDGGIHNCGLYVESPKQPGQAATIHHFSKKNHATYDFRYKKMDGSLYPLTTDNNCTEEQLPNAILRDTTVAINDPNQFGAAIKITTATNDNFIVTVGICLDHEIGVEKQEVRGLIQQLEKNHLSIPSQCNHVITSYSIKEVTDNIISTVSHADPRPSSRVGAK